MSNFDKKIVEYKSVLEPKLQTLIEQADIPEELKEAMLYSVMAGGKRLRGSLLLHCCGLFGGNMEEALPLACAIEMVHTYSLIHDDLPAMDNDDFRRGKPSNHKVFGEAAAILAGDALLSFAFETMINAIIANGYGKHLTDAAAYLTKALGASGMVAGQVLDMRQEKNADESEIMLKSIHEKKTGAIIEASVVAGCMTARADKKTIEALSEYGRLFGLLFQITDDILDVTGNIEELGKSTGKDKNSGKLTYVKLFGLEGARDLAAAVAVQAKDCIRNIGVSDGFLSELIDFTLVRTF